MISKNITDFLKKLKKNNNTDWFHSNKKQYLLAKEEFESFVNIVIYEISRFDKSISHLDVKDCMFRINRDIRFSNDKSPYKTNFGAYLARGGKKSTFAGYYIHIDPEEYFLSGGLYMPESNILKTVRKEIYENTDEFRKIINNTTFKKHFDGLLEDGKLKSAPRDFPKDFPGIDLLKYKHYIVSKDQSEKMIHSSNFMHEIKTVFQAVYPFNSFINKAIENI
jgi:uncharacterized protein (TIGR02453 family)